MVWAGVKNCVGRSPGGSIGALDCFRRMMLSMHSSEADQLAHIEAVVHMLSGEGSSDPIINDTTVQHINKDIKSLFTGETAAKMLGLRVLIALVNVDYWSFPLKITYFYNLARICLPSPDTKIVQLASSCVALLASACMNRDGGLLTAGIVNEESERAVEWLGQPVDKQSRWFCACTILEALLKAVPELVTIRTDILLDRLFVPVWSEIPKDLLAGVTLFVTVLDVFFTDDQDWTSLFTKTVEKVFEGLHRQNPASTKGSLMCLRELLCYSSGQFQTTDFCALADTVLASVEASEVEIKKVAIEVLARMGRPFSDLFGRKYLEDTLEKIEDLYQGHPAHRETVFWALSELCSNMSSEHLDRHVSSIIRYIREGLADSKLRRHALQLLGLLCQVVPQRMEVELGGEEWKEAFRSGPLTENFTETIKRVVQSIPSLKTTLNELNIAAIQEVFASGEVQYMRVALKNIGDVDGVPLAFSGVCDLLERSITPALSSEDQGVRLAASDAAVKLLCNLARGLNDEAATPSEPSLLETASFVNGSLTERPHSMAPVKVPEHLAPLVCFLQPVVDLCVVDMDTAVRRCVLTLLNDSEELIPLLFTPAILDCLFMAFNDESPENRTITLLVLCRLSSSPTVFAYLSRICVQLAGDTALRDFSLHQVHFSELLALLVRMVPNVVEPKAFDVLQNIIVRLRDSLTLKNPSLVASLLTTVGELNDLVSVDDAAAKTLRLELMPLVLDCLEDRQKRVSAVYCLIKIVRSTGLVIDFYQHYPHVLPILLGFLHAKEDWALQNGVMRLIGTIGAVDPLRAKNVSFWADTEFRYGKRQRIGAAPSPAQSANPQSSSQTSGNAPTSSQDKKLPLVTNQPAGKLQQYTTVTDPSIQTQMLKSSLKHQHITRMKSNLGMAAVAEELKPPKRSQPTLVDKLPAVALQALLMILASPMHKATHPKAIDATRQVLKSLSRNQLVKYCPAILPPILMLLRERSPLSRDTHSKLFQLLGTIVAVAGAEMLPHCEAILSVVQGYWEKELTEEMKQRHQHHPHLPTGSAADETSSEEGSTNQPENGLSMLYGGERRTNGDVNDEKALEATPSVPVETLLINVIALVEAMGSVLGNVMADHAHWILANLVQSIQIDKMERMDLIQKCFDAIKTLAPLMKDYMHIVLPLLLDPIARYDISAQLKLRSLSTLEHVLEASPIREHASRVLHQLLISVREVSESECRITASHQLMDRLLRCIHMLLRSIGTAFSKFVPLTKKMLSSSVLSRDPALSAALKHLEATGQMLQADMNPGKLRREEKKASSPSDASRVICCVVGVSAESFNADSFKRTIATHLKVPIRAIEVLRIKGPTTVDFRFHDMDAQSVVRYTNQFLMMVRNGHNGVNNSQLVHDLRLVEVREKSGMCISMQVSALQAIWSTRGKRKARDWEEWINRFSVELLKHSPSQALRACFQAAQVCLPLARELFSYSFVACFQELDDEEKTEVLSHLNTALRANLPPFVLHMILSLAEFMEEERHRSTYSTQGQTKIFKLTRASTEAKFGVGYADVKYEGMTRAHVSKVQPGAPGAQASLQVGGIVNKLNSTRVRNVKHLSELIAGQTVITLELQLPRGRVVTKPSPFFDVDLLAEVSEAKQLLAKALHYKEERFRELMLEIKKADADEVTNLSVNFIELCATLIQLSNNLGLREAANGVLDYYKNYFEEWAKRQEGDTCHTSAVSKFAGKQLDSMLLIEGRGYEKLQWWSQAIKAYKAQAVEDSARQKYVVGIMRCYKQLGRWEHLLYEAKRWWVNSDVDARSEVSGMAAHGAWVLSAWSNLGGESLPSHWDFMETCVEYMPTDGVQAAEREFFLAILNVHKENYQTAEAHINNTRKLLEGRLSSLVGESYARAYNIIVWLQKVMALEEVIEFNVGSNMKWPQLREVWHKRMFGMQPTVENWQDMLAIMALVNDASQDSYGSFDSDDLLLWLKFVSICRRCNRNSLAESTLLTLMGFSTRNFRNFLTDDTVDQHLSTVLIGAHELVERNVAGHVCLSYFKHLYHCDMRTRAADELTTYLRDAVHLRDKCEKLRNEVESLEVELVNRQERAKVRNGSNRDSGSRKHSLRRTLSTGDLTIELPNSQLEEKLDSSREELKRVEAMLMSSDLNDDELMAKLHLTIGDWGQELHKDNFWEHPHRHEILSHFEKAVNLTKTSSRAWHCWGLLNYRIAFRAENLADDPESGASVTAEEHKQRKEAYLVEALRGFFNSLDFLEDESFCVPNLLRILTIWFRYAQRDNIERELLKGIRAIRVSIWIYVLPQLVARVSFPQQRVRNLVEELITLLGAEYPHHVVYPMTVCAFHGDTAARRKCAQSILDRLAHGEREKIFAQAKVVSQGLIKTAISWAEYWASGIEDAAKIHTDHRHSDDKTKQILLDMYPMLDESEPTEAEQLFLETYQPDLESAKRYLVADNFDKAWDQYKKTWDKLQESITKNHSLLLAEVAPQLMETNEEGFDTAVPGVNLPTAGSTILIHSFVNEVKIIQSKQKPKVVIIIGDNGVEYKFLLKGHEDIRQDERVMQLFGLINALFQRADDLYHIHILTTPVVPLSDNVGLIGWLERTETIYHMISDYRQERSIPVNLECSFIMRMGQLKTMEQYYKLTDTLKHEILAACLEKTPSDCLRRVIWMRTSTSELWLEYRTQYVRTLAAMSMVGYILGLGDRHLNNMMLTNEGKIVHIDFGDCFEVAMNRQRFPEQVPFRLTRLLVQAMEASGTEGTFRYTCESVMRCLRKSRDSLTSLLETFVYDPLINWRLMETVAPEEVEAVKEREEERAAGKEADEDYDKTDLTTSLTHRNNDDCASTHTGMCQEDEGPTREPGVDEMCIPADDPEEMDESEEVTLNDEPDIQMWNTHGMEIATALLARSAQIHADISARSVGGKSAKPFEQQREAWEGELVNEKAKQVVIRIRQKLTGFDFPKNASESRTSVSPKPGASPKHEPETGLFDTGVTTRYMMMGGGSYEGSWVMKNLGEDDECDIGVSVAHRETWWLNGQPEEGKAGDGNEDKPTERCTVQEQVHQLILASTSVENLSKMYIGWCPFW